MWVCWELMHGAGTLDLAVFRVVAFEGVGDTSFCWRRDSTACRQHSEDAHVQYWTWMMDE